MVRDPVSEVDERSAAERCPALTAPVFPVVHSVLASAGIGNAVAEPYALDGICRCDLLLAGMNDTYLLTTRHECYVARVYRAAWRSAAEIAYELELLAHLAGKGVRVSVPIPATDGRVVLP